MEEVDRQKKAEVEVVEVLKLTLAVEIGESDQIELVEGLLENQYHFGCSKSPRTNNAVSRRRLEI